MTHAKINKKHSRNLHLSRRRTDYVRPSIARKVILVVIPLVFIIVAVALVYSFALQPEKLTKDRIAVLAAEYYEDYFYPELDTANLDQTMAKFTLRGFTPITLRQLLLYDNQKNHAESNAILKYCDENSTIIRFFPDEPYGVTDYHIEYTYSCNF